MQWVILGRIDLDHVAATRQKGRVDVQLDAGSDARKRIRLRVDPAPVHRDDPNVVPANTAGLVGQVEDEPKQALLGKRFFVKGQPTVLGDPDCGRSPVHEREGSGSGSTSRRLTLRDLRPPLPHFEAEPDAYGEGHRGEDPATPMKFRFAHVSPFRSGSSEVCAATSRLAPSLRTMLCNALSVKDIIPIPVKTMEDD
jgi:hypothetical protein